MDEDSKKGNTSRKLKDLTKKIIFRNMQTLKTIKNQ